MEWSDVAKTVGKVAPVAGSLLAGAAGERVGRLVAGAMGVEAQPEAVAQAVQADPEAALKLRAIEADLEDTLIQGRAQVVTAEAQSESWLARSWRPLTMLAFVGLIGLHWLGLTSDTLTEGEVVLVLEIVKVGLGGYVVGRSAEKITRTATGNGLLERLRTSLAAPKS
ncbi:holin family protein [Halomonas sp. ATCH28]|uniref:Holin family protein n=1 Tax=Halomonas gemina TaxID=2945105 RepID=A0ABT0T2V9_9GAMM|nr:3TM-type holin [Halomonas gemina]MCL7941208.1 holin family protein [Halomonas gemina]